MAEDATWQVVVLIPKGGGKFCGIRLKEVICNNLVVILNQRLGYFIVLHDMLHGFRAGCDVGTTSLETKLFQKLTAMR